MASNQSTSVRAARLILLQSLVLLAVAIVPWPERLEHSPLGDRLGPLTRAESSRT